MIKTNYLFRLIFTLTITLLFHITSFGQSAIYGGGPIYKNRDYSISELKNSGFTHVIVWTIHSDENGDLGFNGEFPLCESGQYIGNETYPYFPQDMASLKAGETNVQRVEFGLSAWGSGTFGHIKTLINAYGTGPETNLYKNFKAIKDNIPAVDGFSFDDESTYDAATATQFAIMLSDIGFKVSLCPYTAASFWTSVATNTNAARPGTIDRIDLQCYAGGSGNSPCNWNFGDIPIFPGLWDTYSTTSQVTSQLTTWKNSCNIKGGFMWLYDDFDNTSATAAYAQAINSVFNGDDGGGDNDAIVVLSEHCDYLGISAQLQVGNYNLSDLQALGMPNDELSSLKIADGYQVTLYQDHNFSGNTLVLTGDIPCLVDAGWNDEASSITVTALPSLNARKVASNTQDINALISPNPLHDKGTITVSLPYEIPATMQIMDLTGKIITTIEIEATSNGQRKFDFDLTQSPKGLYIYNLKQGDKTVIGKFIKQ